ncbi:MAG: hypothetical protein ABW208_12155 [Pyrinomonadaceae bacterium]
MNRSPNEMQDERAGATPDEDAGTFDRSFKYAVIIYAVVEFIAIALVVYYTLAR